MVKKLLFLFFLLSIVKTIAQNDRKPFYGKIYDDLGFLPNAHIINLNTKKATFSKDNGEFRVFVKINDSLKVTSVGYKTSFLVIKPVHLGIGDTKIILKKEIYELDEVEVKKHNLTGSITSDINQVSHKPSINAVSLGLPNAGKRKFTVAERRLYAAKSGILPYLINSINGEIKRLKKFKEIEDQETEIKYLKNTFNSYFLNDLKIDSLQLNSFLYFLEEDDGYIQNKQISKFHLIEFIKEKAKEFKKINNSSE